LSIIDKIYYSITSIFSQQYFRIYIMYNEVLILNEHNEMIIKHPSLYGMKRKSMIWQPYLNLLSKRPRAIKYSNIYHQFPAIWTDYLKDCTVEEQKDALRLLVELLI